MKIQITLTTTWETGQTTEDEIQDLVEGRSVSDALDHLEAAYNGDSSYSVIELKTEVKEE